MPKDTVKARHYLELAAKGGITQARYNLAVDEREKHSPLAWRHWLIAAAAGHTPSLRIIASAYKYRYVSKEEYATALDSYNKVYANEWSPQREQYFKMRNLRVQICEV